MGTFGQQSAGMGGFTSPNTASAFGARGVSGGLTLGGFGGKTSPTTFGGLGGTTGGLGSLGGGGGFGVAGQQQLGFGAKPSGTTSPFGGGGGFGVQPAGGGIFGAPSTGFGAPAATTAFGAPQQQQQQQQQAGGIFGGGGAQTAFGGGMGGGMGGLGGVFGQQQQLTAAGTGNPPFQPFKVEEQVLDRNRNPKIEQHYIQAITAMKPYETKSFEELRIEDYRRNNKHGESFIHQKKESTTYTMKSSY